MSPNHQALCEDTAASTTHRWAFEPAFESPHGTCLRKDFLDEISTEMRQEIEEWAHFAGYKQVKLSL